ncbi:MAG: P-loop NTPase [Thermoplasmatales archaeon]|nr:P-loop NTPase [Thermoplasmatales archaeon]
MEARTSVIDKRLQNINRIIAVASGKGGVGKSLVASTLALSLSKKGYRVGLLDLDLYGPSSHVILGINDFSFPEEEKGILPHKIDDISFMSIVYFTQDKPAPLRGIDITNIIIELLAITQWGELDYLIIDMPPGIGDETLDVIKLVKKSEFLVVTTPSKVAMAAVSKLLKLLKELKLPIIGIVENMKMKQSDFIKGNVSKMGISYLDSIQFDENLEDSIGKPNLLVKTDFMADFDKIIQKII